MELLSSEDHQNNQPLMQAMPSCNSDPSSNMISSSNGIITDDYNNEHSLVAENSLFSIQDEDGFADSPKPNRKMGVTTAIIDGKYTVYWPVYLARKETYCSAYV